MRKLVATKFVILLLVANGIAASTLLNYEHRVVRAAEQIERIKTDKDYSEEGIGYIKRLLPRSEHIEYEGRDVTVDNNWLYALLDSYVAEKDPQQQVARLNEAGGRLRALDEHLKRAEAAATSEPVNSRDKIREILSRPAYQPERETIVGAFVKKVLRKVRGVIGEVYLALQQLLERIFGVGGQGGWIPKLLLFVVLAAAVIVVARLATRIRVPRDKRKKKTRLILGEEVAADGTSRELADAALAAARAGDFRGAVRKLYVSLLYELSERNLIELEDSATNHEYLSRVSRFSALVGPMRYLTDRFDHVWYGMFPSSEEDFAVYLASYLEAIESAQKLSAEPASAI